MEPFSTDTDADMGTRVEVGLVSSTIPPYSPHHVIISEYSLPQHLIETVVAPAILHPFVLLSLGFRIPKP